MNGIKHAKCELCGKQDYAENLVLCGGIFTYLCKPCRNKADKTILRYKRYLKGLPFAEVMKWIMEEG